MRFSDQEIIAMVCFAERIAEADGNIQKCEVRRIITELEGWNKDDYEIDEILGIAEEMETSEAIDVISSMRRAGKRYVAAFLIVVMCADYEVDEDEERFWRLVTNFCDLPRMSYDEAIDFWNQYNN